VSADHAGLTSMPYDIAAGTLRLKAWTEGDAVVFAHGNPTSSYLWRNVMPHLEGLGRLVAADMIGMGGSDKLSSSGPDRYSYAEQRDYLFALWGSLDLGDNVILVLHDWGLGRRLRLGLPAPRPRAGNRVHGGNRHPAAVDGFPRRRREDVPGIPVARGRAPGA
jgi:pimeloyl-ACP methyl ester carboxylesterase